MGRKKSQNSLNSCYSIKLTEDYSNRINSLSKSEKETFNKTLRIVIGRLLNQIQVNQNNSSNKIQVNQNNKSSEIQVNLNNKSSEIQVNLNNDSQIQVNQNDSHEMTEEEFNTFCAELDVEQDDRKLNTESALKTRRSKLNKSFKNDSLHSRYMKDLEDKELMKVVLEDI